MEPDCRLGYTAEQVKALTGDREQEFWHWMRGQTMAICEGQKFNRDTGEYETSCGGVAHGMTIVYPWDLERFLKGLPIID